MEGCTQLKKRKDTSFNIMSQKEQKLKRKLTFDIPKFKFKNGLKQKTSYGSITPKNKMWKCFCRF